jgi:hypothetical protein
LGNVPARIYDAAWSIGAPLERDDRDERDYGLGDAP